MLYYLIDDWFYIVLAIFLIEILWVLLIFRKPLGLKASIYKATEQQPVSVIVVGKNEKAKLEKLVPAILAQNYPDFEVIIVDDQSWDGTYEWMHEQIPLHQNLHLLHIADNVKVTPGKKLALTLAIKKAKNDLLVFTDADCLPVSNNWLSLMANEFDDNTDVVLAYSPYKASANILNPFVRFEGFWVAWQYSAFALAGMPYMGVGRNLAYRKSKFLANKGFAKNLKVPFGDDDLLVQEIANKTNTKVVLHPDAHVETEPKKGPMSWAKQKRRHLSAGRHYKPKFKFLLGLVWASRLAYFVILALYFVFAHLSLATTAILILPLLINWILVITLNYKHKMFTIWYAYPLLDVIYQAVLYPIFGLVSVFHPQKNGW